jgi:hypothetical protein
MTSPSTTRWQKPWVTLLTLVVFAVGVVGASPAGGTASNETEVPVERQVPLLTRVLAFDRSLKGTAPLVLAVVYQAENRASQQAHDAFVRAFERRPASVQGRPVRVVSVSAASAERELRTLGADVAYVAPLRGIDVGRLAGALSEAGVLTLTGVRRYVEVGVALGVGLRDGRPEILLNQRAASAAGADLSARLLQLATVVDS